MKKILYIWTVLSLSVGSSLVRAQEGGDFFNNIIAEHNIPKEVLHHHSKEQDLSFGRGIQFNEEVQEEFENFFKEEALKEEQKMEVEPVPPSKEEDKKNWKKILSVLDKNDSVYDYVNQDDKDKIHSILHHVKEMNTYFPCADASSARGKMFYKHFESLCNDFDLSLESCEKFLMEDGENFCRTIPNLKWFPELREQKILRCHQEIPNLVQSKSMKSK